MKQSPSKPNHFITVFIPVYNGEQYLAESIDAILRQQLPTGYELELLVIDTGSKDSSVRVVEESYLNKVRFMQIPNREFGHGKTRQKAAELAKGEYILFLSQDATPVSNQWLINMIEPFFLGERVGCVFGRQIPRPNAPVTIKREVASVFGGLGATDSIVLSRSRSLVTNEQIVPVNSFFSDVNSAVRRSLLIGKVPFRDLKYAEDQALATDMQNMGYLKAYAPLGAVWHSNEYTPRQYFHRKFDEYIGLQESVALSLKASIRSLLLGWIRPTLHDWKFIRHDHEYTFRSKFVWFAEAPFYNIAERAGRYQALKSINDLARRKKLSLEEKNRH